MIPLAILSTEAQTSQAKEHGMPVPDTGYNPRERLRTELLKTLNFDSEQSHHFSKCFLIILYVYSNQFEISKDSAKARAYEGTGCGGNYVASHAADVATLFGARTKLDQQATETLSLTTLNDRL